MVPSHYRYAPFLEWRHLQTNYKNLNIVQPSIGGLFVGIIGLILFLSSGNPYVFGIGFETMDMLFGGQIVFAVIFALIFLKIIATSLTLGSGGSGGVFTPALFIGSMTGGAFGTVIAQNFPSHNRKLMTDPRLSVCIR